MRIFLPVIVAIGALGVAAAPPTETPVDSDGVLGASATPQLAFEASPPYCGDCQSCGEWNQHENPLSASGTWDGVLHGCNGAGSCGWPEHEQVCFNPQDMDDFASPAELEAIWPTLVTGTAEQVKPILARYANVVFNEDRAAIQVSAACQRDRIIVSIPRSPAQLSSLIDDGDD